MDRGIRPALGDGRLDLGHEDALPPDLIERGGELVAPGAHHDHLDLESAMRGPQGVGHQIGLAQRQRRPAGGQAERVRHEL